MNKFLALLAVTTAVVAATPAIAADVSQETKTSVKISEDGDAKKEVMTKSTDAVGTTTKAETEIKKDVDSDGSADVTVTKKSSTDPKGLMNKTSTKVVDETKVDSDGKAKHSHKKVVNGDTVEDKTTH